MPGYYYPTGRQRTLTITGGGSFATDRDPTTPQTQPPAGPTLAQYLYTLADASVWYLRTSLYGWLGVAKVAGSDEFADRPDIANIHPYFQTYYQTRCTLRVTVGINYDGAADLGRPASGGHDLVGTGTVDLVTPWFIHGYYNPDGSYRGHTSCCYSTVGIPNFIFTDSDGSFTFTDSQTLKEHLKRTRTSDSDLPSSDVDLVPYYAVPCEILGARSMNATANASFTIVIKDVDDSTEPVYYVEQTVGGSVTGSLTFSAPDPPPRDPTHYDITDPELTLNDYGWGYRLQGLGLHKAITASVDFGGTLTATPPGPGCNKGQAALTGTWMAVHFAWGGADPMYKTTPPSGHHWAPAETTWGTALVRAWPDWGLDVIATAHRYKDGLPVTVTMQHVNAVDGTGGPADTIIAEWTTGGTYQPAGPSGTTIFHANSTCDDGTAVAEPNSSGTALYYTLSQPGNSVLVNGRNIGENLTGIFRPKPDWADTYGTFIRSDHWLVHGRENFISPYRHYRQEFLKMSLGQNFQAGQILFPVTHAFQIFTKPWTAAPGGTASHSGTDLVLTFADFEQQAYPTSYGLVPYAFRYHDLVFKADTAGAKVRIGLHGPVTGSPQYGWVLTAGAAGADTTATIDLGKPDQLFIPGGGGVAPHWVGVGRVFHPAEIWSGPLTVTIEAVAPAARSGGTVDAPQLVFRSWTGRYVTGDGHAPIRVRAPLEGLGDVHPIIGYDVNRPDPTAYIAPIQARFLSLIINGINTLEVTIGLTFNVEDIPPNAVGPGTHEGFWQGMFDLYDTVANDTGLTIIRGSGTFYRWPALDCYAVVRTSGGAALPFGQNVDPGSGAIFNGMVRRVAWAYYPGMGDIEGALDTSDVRHPAYGQRIKVRLEWIFDGEAFGNTGAPYTPAAVSLLDNPGDAILASGEPDADGFFTLQFHYGVVHPVGNVSLASEAGTSIGNNLNSYFIALGSSTKHAGLMNPDGTVGRDLVILDRYPTRLLVVPAAQGIWNMHDSVGAYHRASVEGGRIRYRRSDLPTPSGTPPWNIEVDATDGGNDSQPRMAASGIDRVELVFVRDADVMLTWSDDDGATWSDPMLLFAGSSHPHNVATDIGTVIHFAWDLNNIWGKEEIAPGQFTDAWVFQNELGDVMDVDDDSFCVSQATEGAARYILTMVQGGDVVEFESADDCRTWKLVS